MSTKHKSIIEIREIARYLQQLQEEGIDTGESSGLVDAAREPCPLDISMGLDYGGVFESGLNVIYAVPIRIVPQARVVIADCQFETEWDDLTICLPHLTLRGDSYLLDNLKFPRARVLNQYVEEGRTLNCGLVMQGMILAYGYCSVPSEQRSGTDIPLRLTMIDSLGRSATAMISLAFERATPRRRSFVVGAERERETPDFRRQRHRDKP